MAVNVTVRVIRVWDVEVPAEYGDTEETLTAKVSDEFLDATPPDADQRHLLPDLAAIPDQSTYTGPDADPEA